MRSLYEELKREEKKLIDIINRTTNFISGAPKGKLRISHNGNKEQYYYREVSRVDEKMILSEKKANEEKNMENDGGVGVTYSLGKYIRQADVKLAYNLAQRDYDEDLLKLAKKRLAHVQAMLKDCESDEMEGVYEKLNPYRKKLVTPRIITNEEYASKWSAVEYEKKSFEEGTAVIMSDKGERVRSKSEKIIADMLQKNGVPYRYEAPLTFKNGRTIHPDFTVLNVTRKQEIYWEHLGMMDNTDYCESALARIEMYQRNKIILGENLIISYETSKHPIETVMIERNIREFCLK